MFTTFSCQKSKHRSRLHQPEGGNFEEVTLLLLVSNDITTLHGDSGRFVDLLTTVVGLKLET